MPAIFLGHGNPMNALRDNAYTRRWAALGAALPQPRAVLSISAHWYVPATAVTANAQPRTIHDFGGFPRELHEMQYPAPGAPELAARVAQLLAPVPVELEHGWGLDHGTWSILVHMYPNADIPVIQLSIDETKDANWHHRSARQLAALRDEGILIIGSGNLVHNLHTYAWGRRGVEPYDWAVRFETRARELLLVRDFAPLVAYETLGRDAMLSAPTPEHYLPLLYVLAQHHEHEPVSFPVEGFDGGSISMLAVQLG
ncbi:Extradiol ring-cleavage dioxygenase, class III enzyme, subunit B [Nitrococcus mobilis Nb-231]|uniref:Extradiol ring-cleavage dioxygenase, class III enzyme, subunit B n=2 Tax=Nitrococcus mobilis TaxID=35797 RepID=A4BPH8_9GAMM|nr:Extradiol ring-cleavage dioxygenase, class III enzyme, subunit B [Nitrococcus mobilis Nb-231]